MDPTPSSTVCPLRDFMLVAVWRALFWGSSCFHSETLLKKALNGKFKPMDEGPAFGKFLLEHGKHWVRLGVSQSSLPCLSPHALSLNIMLLLQLWRFWQWILTLPLSTDEEQGEEQVNPKWTNTEWCNLPAVHQEGTGYPQRHFHPSSPTPSTVTSEHQATILWQISSKQGFKMTQLEL